MGDLKSLPTPSDGDELEVGRTEHPCEPLNMIYSIEALHAGTATLFNALGRHLYCQLFVNQGSYPQYSRLNVAGL